MNTFDDLISMAKEGTPINSSVHADCVSKFRKCLDIQLKALISIEVNGYDSDWKTTFIEDNGLSIKRFTPWFKKIASGEYQTVYRYASYSFDLATGQQVKNYISYGANLSELIVIYSGWLQRIDEGHPETINAIKTAKKNFSASITK